MDTRATCLPIHRRRFARMVVLLVALGASGVCASHQLFSHASAGGGPAPVPGMRRVFQAGVGAIGGALRGGGRQDALFEAGFEVRT